MYHAIVRRRIIALFDAINRGDAEPLIASFAPVFEHVFIGDHALAGTRRSLGATRAWYQRLYRLLPGIRFDVRRVAVAGTPWNTIALAAWDETSSGADGVSTRNSGVHVVELSWGRVVRLVICPDTAGLEATLRRLAGGGHDEAVAGPITG